VLYGTTQLAGDSTYAMVFELAPPASPGGIWTETTLQMFLPDACGFEYIYECSPNGLNLGPDGTLYGTIPRGGTGSLGTVFALTP